MRLAAGTLLGPYEIVAPLGAGGMGEVYRARDTRLDRAVALKVLPPGTSADPIRKQRFEREARTISSLSHPNLCVLYDVGTHEGVDYLVMELLEGETLSARLERGPLPIEQAIRYGAQIADGLAHAHRAGVVHRDLKPGNVMLTASGAKLLDFGLAKSPVLSEGLTLTAAPAQKPVTQKGMIVGTFQYMSPEQIEGGEVDSRSDIFSLGAVLYESLTGQKAFEGKSQMSVASAILEKEPAPIRSLRPLTPPTLERTVGRCLEKRRDARWQDASDLAAELRWAGEEASRRSEGAASGPGSGAVAGWVVSAALFLLLVGGLFLWLRTREGRGPQYFASPFHLAVNDLALSADGKVAAVVAYSEEANQYVLWTYRLGEPSAKLVEGTEGAAHPFWSPDGKWIGFFAQGKLKKVLPKVATPTSSATRRTGGAAPGARPEPSSSRPTCSPGSSAFPPPAEFRARRRSSTSGGRSRATGGPCSFRTGSTTSTSGRTSRGGTT
jgi:hypothetical protein